MASFEARMKAAEKLKAVIEDKGGGVFTARVWGTAKSGSGLPSSRVYVNASESGKAVAGLSISGELELYLADVYKETDEELEQFLALLDDLGYPTAPTRNTKTQPQPKRAARISI